MPVTGYLVLVKKYHVVPDARNLLPKDVYIKKNAVAWLDVGCDGKEFSVVVSDNSPPKVVGHEQSAQEPVAVWT